VDNLLLEYMQAPEATVHGSRMGTTVHSLSKMHILYSKDDTRLAQTL
jgi:hypothetical protein